jgi:hypothetical protein
MSIKHIRINIDDLERKRCKSVTTLLRPVLHNKQAQATFFATGKDEIRIITLDQFKNRELRETRFKIQSSEFTGMYYEIWRKVDRKLFELEKMYFHLFNSEDEAYILLHCDPNDSDVTHGNYKRSPHLHIEQTPEAVIKKAHLALNITNYDTIFENIDTLTKAFGEHILMIKSQILDSKK